MKRPLLIALTIGMLSISAGAQTKTFRASEMTSQQWSQLSTGTAQEMIVEFRQGDEIPVSFAAEGDLLETSRTGVSYVKVKRSFWLRLQQDSIEVSLDGSVFKPVSDILSGSFTAGAGSPQPGIPVNAINLMLKATLK